MYVTTKYRGREGRNPNKSPWCHDDRYIYIIYIIIYMSIVIYNISQFTYLKLILFAINYILPSLSMGTERCDQYNISVESEVELR